ncbi:MAG: 3-deoxy-D-manno-octulosonic acid transferase [Flavobacteriales bacterium]|nr:3-deoxy-D-manno-octulosonic acid transferase [Flavobacteriales bacterium]HQV53328.1 glycosyltransferase N-terminal domain-containing protein [Flavobacteriales bacterium]HQX31450.1 glycosyltransferase N-terminal domain-containing protein [Flavobacteriales bacterium]HQX39529.1 glycosyltransferase N-terminal domain-containing protein [Flavobacteriales bacterium]
MPLLYDLGTRCYHLGIRLAAPFVPKAKQWVNGRKGTWERLASVSKKVTGCLWMHAASVGEFEQGLPVLEAIKKIHPDLPIVVTFFSPSGYEARKDHPIADHVEYLPPDGRANAERLYALIKPRIALFVKYEFWYHHLKTLHHHNVPLFLISGTFRNDQPFFNWYGNTHRAMLSTFSHLFVQDEKSRSLLASLGKTNVTVAGDTRFDRVAEIAANDPGLAVAKAWKGDQPLLVCGSTWPADEELILAAFGKYKLVVVPHELSEPHLKQIETRFPKPLVRWSELEDSPIQSITDILGKEKSGTLLVDRMGLLARLYAYADIVYIGGGFGDGIHSVLEAVAWGKPVIFGPNHRKFVEAEALVEAGAGFEVSSSTGLRTVLERLNGDPNELQNSSAIAKAYVQNNVGATAKITAFILPLLEAKQFNPS